MELTTLPHAWRTSKRLFMMSKIQNLNGTHNCNVVYYSICVLFMMSKIQNLNGTHNATDVDRTFVTLFMMSKIQNLNGTHNMLDCLFFQHIVVYDVKDTKFEWNSQRWHLFQLKFVGCL